MASRTTYCAGNAVKLAAEDLKNKILDLAEIKMGAVKRDLEFRDGYVVHKIYPDRRYPISEFALGLAFPDGSGYGGPRLASARSRSKTTSIRIRRRALRSIIRRHTGPWAPTAPRSRWIPKPAISAY